MSPLLLLLLAAATPALGQDYNDTDIYPLWNISEIFPDWNGSAASVASPRQIIGNFPFGFPDGLPVGPPGNLPGGLLGGQSGGLPSSFPGGLLGGQSGSLPGGLLGGLQGGLLGGLSGGLGGGASNPNLQRVMDTIRNRLVQRAIPAAIRLAFHDSIGGADGCIDLSNQGNAGLQSIKRDMDRMAAGSGMSKADVYALAGQIAVQKGIERYDPQLAAQAMQIMNFQDGRTDCGFPQQRNIPSAHSDTNAVMNFFRQNYALNEREIVALMGAHSMGRANQENSGFVIAWTADPFVLNNEYFQNLMQDFQQVGDNTGRFFWRSPTGQTMLNADIAIVKNIQTSPNGQSLTCQRTSQCPNAPTARYVQEFARDNNAFVIAFANAWRKMTGPRTQGLQGGFFSSLGQQGNPTLPGPFGIPPGGQLGNPTLPGPFRIPPGGQLGNPTLPGAFGIPPGGQLGNPTLPGAFGIPPAGQQPFPFPLFRR